ncbi:RES family NAD+ phosphorylase [Xinfangfangia sp. D13-10-4-6]|uniref:RES family NAD+ phosphorylase n=1 Tax=Pseudogemmobacter hezensis TaxID=2737662 RepID=UPI00155674C2|nr:RES family NAD+ phosphorylase [Pseudogemmobacter hezensis]NPD15956.1 RES family NAD+ phosphorylase [Pseudogemmobacter hezensis]
MSAPISTPAAPGFELTAWSGRAWRLVEAQHLVSTLKLVDSLAEQAMLEDILETTKPVMPAACQGLDYLLATPFRYRPYPHGSRFRRAGLTPGVWYGAEKVQTALAEMVFYRFLFYAESPQTPFPDGPAEYTAFAAKLATERALDLTTGPLADDPRFTHLSDYSHCQDLAESVRAAEGEVIRYRSLRDPKGDANLAVLSCTAFAAPGVQDRQTWRIRLSASGAMALREHPRQGIDYPRDTFSADPRLAVMKWDRPRAR